MDSLFAGFMHTDANSFLTCLPSIVEAKLVCRIQGPEEQKPHDRSSNNSTLVRRRCWGDSGVSEVLLGILVEIGEGTVFVNIRLMVTHSKSTDEPANVSKPQA